MKLINCRRVFCSYNYNTSYKSNTFLSFSKRPLPPKYYSSTTAGEVPISLLNNPGVRTYLDKLISEDFTDSMAKPHVTTLISSIRSLRVDIQSLNEFNTGHYNISSILLCSYVSNYVKIS